MFLHEESKVSNNSAKKGGFVIVDREFDMSMYATEEEEEVTVNFPKKAKAAHSAFKDIELDVKFLISYTSKEVDAN